MKNGLNGFIHNDITAHGAAVEVEGKTFFRVALACKDFYITVNLGVTGYGNADGRIRSISANIKCKTAFGVRIDGGINNHGITIIIGKGVGRIIVRIFQSQCHAFKSQVRIVLDKHFSNFTVKSTVLEDYGRIFEKLECLCLCAGGTCKRLGINGVSLAVKVNDKIAAGSDRVTVTCAICKESDCAVCKELTLCIYGRNCSECFIKALVLHAAHFCNRSRLRCCGVGSRIGGFTRDCRNLGAPACEGVGVIRIFITCGICVCRCFAVSDIGGINDRCFVALPSDGVCPNNQMDRRFFLDIALAQGFVIHKLLACKNKPHCTCRNACFGDEQIL